MMDIQQQLAEVDDLLRSVPGWDALHRPDNDEATAWRGRFLAVVEAFGTLALQSRASSAMTKASSYRSVEEGRGEALTVLHQLRYSLRLKSGAPTTAAIPAAAPFEYFDYVRQLVEAATSDVLFVDPYLDADFVARYLPSVRDGVGVRLLGSNKITALAASVEAFTKQHGLKIAIRQSATLHDRFVFVDGARCYQSGASFKDGAAKAPSVISQIVDAFDAMKSTYETQWARAEAVRNA